MSDATSQSELFDYGRMELDLMLSGNKPCSMFCDFPPIAEFEEHVASGEFVKTEHALALGAKPDTEERYIARYYFYALKGEEWRIAALVLALTLRAYVRRPRDGTGPIHLALEVMISCLLGYSTAQIEDYYQEPFVDKNISAALTACWRTISQLR